MDQPDIERITKIEAILVREVVDLATEYSEDASILESLTEITFTLSRLFDEMGYSRASDHWTDLFNYYDRKHYSLENHTKEQISHSKVQEIYAQALAVITPLNQRRAEQDQLDTQLGAESQQRWSQTGQY